MLADVAHATGEHRIKHTQGVLCEAIDTRTHTLTHANTPALMDVLDAPRAQAWEEQGPIGSALAPAKPADVPCEESV